MSHKTGFWVSVIMLVVIGFIGNFFWNKSSQYERFKNAFGIEYHADPEVLRIVTEKIERSGIECETMTRKVQHTTLITPDDVQKAKRACDTYKEMQEIAREYRILIVK